VLREAEPVSRLEVIVARSGGAARIVGGAEAWRAAQIVTDAFGREDHSRLVHRARLVGNFARLRIFAPSVINRERTAVVGVGGVRPLTLVVSSIVAGWLAPRLPRLVRVVLVVGVVGSALHRNRMRRIVWVRRAVRRHAPDALLVGEFAASEPGAGVAFATELLEAVGRHTAMAATVQGPCGDRRARAQIRLYERRLGFTVADRRVMDGDELVLLTRARTPVPDEPALSSAG
jgi:hypothetical protein